MERDARIPWYIWLSVAGVTSAMIGVHWDISWHRSIGRDTFWTPAHLAIQLCGVIAGITCGYLILWTTFGAFAIARSFGQRAGLPRAAGSVHLRLGRIHHDHVGAVRQLVA